MKIAIIGHKRIPSNEGGIEKGVEQHAVRMVQRGNDVTVYNRGGHNVFGKEFDIEAIINIVLSVILVFKFGLEGIAVGTFIGMLYRMIYLVWFINKDIMPYPISNIVKRLSLSISTIVISCLIVSVLDTTGSSTLILWVKNGVLCFGVYCAVTVVLNFAFDKELFLNVCKKAVRKRKG